MRAGPLAAPICGVLAILAAAGCGAQGGGSSSTSRTTLTIYSSSPLQGAELAQSEAIVKGEKLALAEVDGRVGRFTIKLSNLDDATAAVGRADPGQVSSDARKAAQDPSTIAYLGETDDGASAVSIPILNEAGIMQISPSDTAVGFTRADGADKGAPEKYYPSGKRTFARVMPADDVQAAALGRYQLDEGCTKTFVASARTVFGASLTTQFELVPKASKPAIVKQTLIAPGTRSFAELAREVTSSHADCMLFAGITADYAVRAFTAVHDANPTVALFGSSGVAASSFAKALPTRVQRSVYVTSPTLDPKLYPPAGQQFFTTFREKYGKQPEPAAIYGYEAMKLALLAIQNAGDKGNDRPSVIAALFKVRDRDSVLGRYSIDAGGDTTLSEFAADRVRDGKLVFAKALRVAK